MVYGPWGAKLFGALRRLRELGFGAREIAVHKAR
jgi:hypothetical protein